MVEKRSVVSCNRNLASLSNDLCAAYQEHRLSNVTSQYALKLGLRKLRKRRKLICIRNPKWLINCRGYRMTKHFVTELSRILWQGRLEGSSIRHRRTDLTLNIGKVKRATSKQRGEGGGGKKRRLASNWHSWEHHSTAHI